MLEATKTALLLGFVSAAIGLWGQSASANIVYDVDQTIGSGSVTGTITTDGATGLLSASDITAWNLTLTGAGGATYTLINGTSGVEVGNKSDPLDPNAGNNDVTADAHHIYFNYDGTDGGYLGFQELPFYGGQEYWCNASLGQGVDCRVGKSVVPVYYANSSSQFASASGNQIIASVVPEPSTWVLMLLGFGALAAGAYRQTGRARLVSIAS